MGKFKKKRKPVSVPALIDGVLKHPFDVSMATLIVLVDIEPRIAQYAMVKRHMASLTEGEQEYAVMLEAALQANKVQKTRMQEAVDVFNTATGSTLRIGNAAHDLAFAAWLPGYNAKLQQEWRDANPEQAAAYDAQQALMTQGVGVPFELPAVAMPLMDHAVQILQATDPQGDVSEQVPEGVVPVGWDKVDGDAHADPA